MSMGKEQDIFLNCPPDYFNWQHLTSDGPKSTELKIVELKWNTGHPMPVWTANAHGSTVYCKWEINITQKSTWKIIKIFLLQC